MSVVGPGPHPICQICLGFRSLAAIDVIPTAPPTSTVVLVPGYTGSKEDFAPITDGIVASRRRFVAIDQRGQHHSAGPDSPAEFTIDMLAADLLELRAALGPGPVHLVGHSFGGLVSRAAVLRAPTAFASLTLLGSGPAAVGGESADRVRALRALLQTMTLEQIADLTDGDPVAAARPPEVRAFLRERFVATSAASFDGMGEAILAEPDRVDELRDAGVPLLVAHGEGDDVWLPAVQRTMAERLAAAYAVIDDAMHSPAVENPAQTVAVLTSFWAAVETDQPHR